MTSLRAFLALTKARIAILSTLTAATGYLVFARALEPGILPACLGVLLLAMGACALNEWQERELDARMERTRRRPIPSGAISPRAALAIALALDLGGLLVLSLAHGLPAAFLGLLAVLWYNGVYTYLKRLTAFAAVPGSLIGALPPAIGWTAAGGDPLDPQALALCCFFFLWQVPHFWLLLFAFGEDYRRAGLPAMTDLFSRRQLARLVFIWMLATAASSLLLPIFGLAVSDPARLGLLGAALWLAWKASRLVLRPAEERRAFRLAFQGINLYALAVMGLLALDTAL